MRILNVELTLPVKSEASTTDVTADIGPAMVVGEGEYPNIQYQYLIAARDSFYNKGNK